MSTYTLDDFIVSPSITNSDLLSYANSHVNLPSDRAKEHRDQANILREKLEKYIDEHPDYNLVKMLHSGSVAKGTALRQVNDIDVAVYVRAAEAPETGSGLTLWLLDRLQEVYPNFDNDQFQPQDHCITINYRSGLSVDVVPVLYEGDADNKGYLITKSGEKVLTSISRHLDFIRKRKGLHPNHYVQLIRFIKWWVRRQKDLNQDYKFKSMMVELICAHLVDKGLEPSNYIEALQSFYAYIVRTGLKEPIYFGDYYNPKSITLTDLPIQIYDPVNPENNIAHKYTELNRQLIVSSAVTALNAITTAANSTTQAEAVSMWQKVFGPTFRK
ncbi:MAG: hypothetical protein BroJett025_08380 [Patescibacteria group bacterium]|nr:MAG: hypothetical protein BroJett025_08380 [Patescibacteria group bacterium]